MLLWPFNHYPGSDYESFNYDWIIGKLKELKNSVAAALSSEQAAAESADEAHASLLAAIAQATRARTYAEHAADSAHDAADSAAGIADVVDQVNTNTGRINNLIANAGDGTLPSEVVDMRVAVDGHVYATAGEAVRTQITELFDQLHDLDARDDMLMLNGFAGSDGNGYFDTNGTVIQNAGYVYSETIFPVKPGATYRGNYYNGSYFTGVNSTVVWYTECGNIISRTLAYNQTAPENAYYAKVAIQAPDDSVMFIEGTTPEYYIQGLNIVYKSNYDSLLENAITSYEDLPLTGEEYVFSDLPLTRNSGYMDIYNILTESSQWEHVNIPVSGGEVYNYRLDSASRAYAMMIFNEDGVRIGTIPQTLSGNQSHTGTIKMPAMASSITVNSYAGNLVLKKATAKSVSSMTVLTGKKLYAAGDSITEAVNAGTFSNGWHKSYEAFVALRNSMTLVTDAIGGSTMGVCTINGTPTNNYISTARYQNVPADADFVTYWFGWNDNAYGWKSKRDAYCYTTYNAYYDNLTSEQKTAVDNYKTWRDWLDDYNGSLDGTDTSTWSGAWNTVLTWMLNNRPNCRIGIIIPYGVETVLTDRLEELCNKYGIGYVKAYDPHEFFSVGYSIDIGEVQATKRKALYTLDGTHPNALGYEMMSNGYEQFLMRI